MLDVVLALADTYGVTVDEGEADNMAKAITNIWSGSSRQFTVKDGERVMEVKLSEAKDGAFHLVQMHHHHRGNPGQADRFCPVGEPFQYARIDLWRPRVIAHRRRCVSGTSAGQRGRAASSLL